MEQNYQRQPTLFCSDANVPVAQQAASSAAGTDGNNVPSMNNGEWTHEEKIRIVQNLVDSICRFAKEGWRAKISRNQTTEISTDWNTEMKISIIIIDEKTASFGHIY